MPKCSASLNNFGKGSAELLGPSIVSLLPERSKSTVYHDHFVSSTKYIQMSFDASRTVERKSVNNPRNQQQQKPPVYKGMSSVVFTFTAAISLEAR